MADVGVALATCEALPGRWARHEQLFTRYLPYVLLAASLALAALTGHGWALLGAAAVSVLAALCVLAFSTLRPSRENRAGLMTAYLGIRLVITAVLVVLNPWFALFAWIGYVDFFRLPLRGGRAGRAAGVLATAMLMAGSQVGGFGNLNASTIGAYVVMLLLNGLLAGSMGGFAMLVQHRNEQRQIALAELAETNRRLSATLAENAGLHAQLLNQAREAGVLDERARLAREIHDTLAQGLTGIITQLQAAQRPEQTRRRIDIALALARDSLGEARRSVQALRPAPLEHAGLPDALAEVVADWSARHDVPAGLATNGTVRPMYPEVEVSLLRTAQEALANVARHARARRVGVTLSYMDDMLVLDVRDDGVGFDPGAPQDPAARGGFGLVSMRQRVSRLGGVLSVESEPGSGTAVSATVPVAAQAAA